jgi:hypothetical protein
METNEKNLSPQLKYLEMLKKQTEELKLKLAKIKEKSQFNNSK